jgi:CheY-like chemotaxis protein
MSIIMVVEDDFIMSEYLSGILAEKGYSVIAVANAWLCDEQAARGAKT